jgi:hypothetical protein
MLYSIVGLSLCAADLGCLGVDRIVQQWQYLQPNGPLWSAVANDVTVIESASPSRVMVYSVYPSAPHNMYFVCSLWQGKEIALKNVLPENLEKPYIFLLDLQNLPVDPRVGFLPDEKVEQFWGNGSIPTFVDDEGICLENNTPTVQILLMRPFGASKNIWFLGNIWPGQSLKLKDLLPAEFLACTGNDGVEFRLSSPQFFPTPPEIQMYIESCEASLSQCAGSDDSFHTGNVPDSSSSLDDSCRGCGADDFLLCTCTPPLS